jgi:Flp pilus assembly protein TadD
MDDETTISRTEAVQLTTSPMALGRGEINLAHALGIDPHALAQLAQKALGLIPLGKLDEAEEVLAKLARVDAHSTLFPFLLGACRAMAGDRGRALRAYGEALRRAEHGDADAHSMK